MRELEEVAKELVLVVRREGPFVEPKDLEPIVTKLREVEQSAYETAAGISDEMKSHRSGIRMNDGPMGEAYSWTEYKGDVGEAIRLHAKPLPERT